MPLISDEIKKNPTESTSPLLLVIPLVFFILIVAGGIFFLKPKQPTQHSNQNANQNIAAATNVPVNRFVNSAGTAVNQNTNQATAVNTSPAPNQNTNTPAVKKTNGEWVGLLKTTQGYAKLAGNSITESFTLADDKGIPNNFFVQELQTIIINGELRLIASQMNSKATQKAAIITWKIGNDIPIILRETQYDLVSQLSVSPDSTEIAYVGINNTPDQLTGEELKKDQYNHRTFWIYNIKKLQGRTVGWNEPIQKLQWTPAGLLVFGLNTIALFNPQTSKFTTSFAGNANTVISPDGTMYYDSKANVIRTVPGGQAILLNRPQGADELTVEKVKVFSKDSKKLLLAERKTTQTDSEFRFAEFNIAERKFQTFHTMTIPDPKARLELLEYDPNRGRILWQINDMFIMWKEDSRMIAPLEYANGSAFDGGLFITWYQEP